MSSKPNTQQGELIVIAEQSGQMYVPNNYFDNQEEGRGPGVSLVGHYIHLQNAVTNIARHNMLEGYVAKDNRDIEDNKTHMHATHRANVEGQVVIAKKKAEQSFAAATGGAALLASIEVPFATGEEFTFGQIGAVGALDGQQWSKFWTKYHKPSSYKMAQEDRRKWVNITRVMQREEITKFNRIKERRPHLVKEESSVARKAKTDEDRKLDTRQRLTAINNDPRAGFIPATNEEKNQVMAFLDYLDNPQHPFGINNQFLEVFSHSQKLRRKDPTIDSERGPVSITYELGDYLTNAVEQRRALEELESILLDSPNLRVTVQDEADQDLIDPSHPGFTALLRYRDLKQYMDTGEATLRNDPLLTKPYRWSKNKTGTDKNKRIEDRYTGKERPKSMDKPIKEATQLMTIGEARQLVGPAIADQLSRESMMRQLLEAIATPPTIMQGKAREVLQAASNTAHKVLEELQVAA